MLILGIGGFKGSGKDTVGSILREYHGFRTFAFADPLKQAAANIFDLSYPQLYGTLAEKETVDPRWGLTPREILQRLGTEVGRGIHPEVWTKSMRYRIERELRVWAPATPCAQPETAPLRGIAVTDVRFANEADMVRSMGGAVVRVDRPGVTAGVGGLHPSEALAFEAEHVLNNNSSIEALEAKVCALLHVLRGHDCA